MLLYTISDLERVSDHAVSLLMSAESLQEQGFEISAAAREEYEIISAAVTELLYFTSRAFIYRDLKAAESVEPLCEIVVSLKEQIRSRHVLRMQKGICGIAPGFIWVDVLTCMERVAGHCSNIAASEIEIAEDELGLHGYARHQRTDSRTYQEHYRYFAGKYTLPKTRALTAPGTKNEPAAQ